MRADVALDTPVYNGHTTVVELLWAGVPVVTVGAWDAMAARLAGSLTHAIGLGEMQVGSLKEYEEFTAKLISED